MNQSRIPNSVTALKKRMALLVGDLDAIQWEIAGLIFAYTTDDSGDDVPRQRGVFSHYGIRGFSHADKVKAYQDAYRVAITEGIVPFVSPGDDLTIPSATFAGYYGRTAYRKRELEKRRRNRTPSLQGEKSGPVDAPPTPPKAKTGERARVRTVVENLQAAMGELKVAAEKEPDRDSGRYFQLRLAESALQNAIDAYAATDATVAA